MIDREKYNEHIDEIINQLIELKITDENSKMCEVDRVTCIGGISLQLEDLAEDLDNEMSDPSLGGLSKNDLIKK